MTNTRPKYFAVPAVTVSGKPVPGRFDIFEAADIHGETFICHVGTRDTLEQLLRRGIPTEDAKALAKEIGR